jgi:hypothetical protein
VVHHHARDRCGWQREERETTIAMHNNYRTTTLVAVTHMEIRNLHPSPPPPHRN